MKPKRKPQTVAQYIAAAPKQSRAKLIQIRAYIRSAAPRATESLKWGMPAYSYHRILVTFAGFNKHIGFYPTPGVIKAFAKELAGYKTGKGSIQFPLDKPLPQTLIRKLTARRVKDYLKTDAKWM